MRAARRGAWIGLLVPPLRPLYDYAWFVGFADNGSLKFGRPAGAGWRSVDCAVCTGEGEGVSDWGGGAALPIVAPRRKKIAIQETFLDISRIRSLDALARGRASVNATRGRNNAGRRADCQNERRR